VNVADGTPDHNDGTADLYEIFAKSRCVRSIPKDRPPEFSEGLP
jgi:hypothetical protein